MEKVTFRYVWRRRDGADEISERKGVHTSPGGLECCMRWVTRNNSGWCVL